MAVIDTQTHWYSRTLWDAYLELDQYPRCRRDGDAYAFELAPDRWFPIPPPFFELELQLETFEAAGIDTVISSSASFGDVDRLAVEVATEVAFKLNQERADAQREHEGRFFGLATLPWQDTDAALQVLDEAANLGLKGALIHSNVAGQPIDADQRRPVYARLAELDLPLCLHPARTIAEEQLRDYGLEYVLGYMFDTSTAALRLVFSGIAAANPGLRVVHPHCGATLPYLAGRVDSSHDKPYSLGERLPTLPSEQLAHFYTDTVCQNPATLAYARSFYEPGHVVFGSDFPYFSAADELAFVRESVDDDQAILAGNSAKLFSID